MRHSNIPSVSDYFLEIESHFALRRNTPFILSAKDWALMKQWHGEGVPLPVVIEAIDTVFERNETSGRRKTISSLSYCKHAVKDLWTERKELYVGDAEVTPEAAPEALLAALADAIAPHDEATAVAVRELAREQSVPRIEELLLALEATLIEKLAAALPPEELKEMRGAITRAIGDASKLDEKTRARTEEANLRRLVRDRYGLPRLTLFG
jgi:hypothetical protein